MVFQKGHKFGKRFKKGNISWNKGKKGIHLSTKTEFKKGNIPWNKGKKMEDKYKGKNIYNWKGGKVGYFGLHNWVRSELGQVSKQKCKCGKQAKHWANIDHKYKRILKDYIAMCPSCHKKYDIKLNTRKQYITIN